ncbi:2-oxo acid dehydrogenase subunit E2 [Micromonospora sp. NPDC049230]|uniref:2-oxo acid dehydrogenase subunit E2 n=1 Tax=Micromonospora sp. NPDC049230 TaxID=3155502 RepID=UPI003403D0D4
MSAHAVHDLLGVAEFTAIVNPPHASILSVGAIAARPVVLSSGELAARSAVNVVLSVDHRAIDGALAAEWMRAFTAAIRATASLLV